MTLSTVGINKSDYLSEAVGLGLQNLTWPTETKVGGTRGGRKLFQINMRKILPRVLLSGYSTNSHLDLDNLEFDTRVIHSNQFIDPYSGAVNPPIYMSSTFCQVSPGVMYEANCDYTRAGNPTRSVLEGLIANLENGKYGHVASSGLGATSNIITLLKEGDHVVVCDDLYGGTRQLFEMIYGELGLRFTFVDMTDLENFESVLTKDTKMVWGETPTNPTLKIMDIEEIANITKSVTDDAIFVVDNTFMSPYFQNPLDLGADIVFHSCTKYINGHSDVVMGVCVTSDEELNEELLFRGKRVGASASPADCYLCIRGIRTLQLRMEKHESNAIALSKYLDSHPKVQSVIYPGLESHPQHDIAKKQMSGFGGMITFYVDGEVDEARSFLENLSVFMLAESLGGVESLAESPALMTHASLSTELRKELGVEDNLIRLSVGIENPNDLILDLETALSFV